jgi:hypothetical protein
VLRWHDAKALQLLDDQLGAGGGAAAAAAELCKLISPQAGAAAGEAGGQAATSAGVAAEAVRLLCDWATAAPAADFGAALGLVAAPHGGGEGEWRGAQGGVEALVPERLLFAMAVLQALAAAQQAQQQQPEQQEHPPHDDRARRDAGAPPLQPAIHAWLTAQAERGPTAGQRRRALHLALLLAEAALLCPAALLHSCLASGACQVAAAAAGPGTCAPPAASCAPLVDVLEQLHPLLDLPSLGPASGGGGWSQARLRYAAARDELLAQCGRGSAGQAAAEGEAGAQEGQAEGEDDEKRWEELLAGASGLPAASSGSSGSNGSSGAQQQQRQRQQAQQAWRDAALEQLQLQLLSALGLAQQAQAGSAGAATAGPSFGQLLQGVRRLQPWQQRHTAASLLAAAKAFLSSTDAGGGGRASSPASGSPPPSAPSAAPPAGWELCLLAVLQACAAHREALSLLATCLNLLQRALAGAVRAAAAGGQPAALGEAVGGAQSAWSQRSRVSPPLLLSLLAAHGASLAASDIAAKLLPMLTGGLWRVQGAPLQAAARQALAGQLDLAAQLLALPGAGPQAWLDRMRQQHGAAHWLVALLEGAAAGVRARGAADAPAGQQGAQQAQQAAELLAGFWSKTALLPAGEGGEAGGGAASGGEPAPGSSRGPQPSLLQVPGLPGDDDGLASQAACGAAAALAAMQHSLPPPALPALLQHLREAGGCGAAEHSAGAPACLRRGLAALAPAASRALLGRPQQAYAALRQQRQHLHPATPPPWQLALALLGSAGGLGAAAAEALAGLSAGEALAAAAAALTPATARCAWLLLRLLLDEQQWQGGHRLAEAERQLAQR